MEHYFCFIFIVLLRPSHLHCDIGVKVTFFPSNQLLVDKDTVMNAVTSSHDVHLLKIDNKEDDIVTRINGWLKNMITSIHNEEEIKRNRTRVTEINHLIDHLREESEGLDLAAGG